jgi:hypothetical protein
MGDKILLLLADLQFCMVNRYCLRNVAMTCKNAFYHQPMHNLLASSFLTSHALEAFIKYWFLRTATRFAVCPPQAVLLRDSQSILASCEFVTKAVHSLYNNELENDPYEDHPMRNIRLMPRRWAMFPGWKMVCNHIHPFQPRPFRDDDEARTWDRDIFSQFRHYQSMTHMVDGHTTWWASWPSDPEMTWPLALNSEQISDIINRDPRLLLPVPTDYDLTAPNANGEFPFVPINFQHHQLYLPHPIRAPRPRRNSLNFVIDEMHSGSSSSSSF